MHLYWMSIYLKINVSAKLQIRMQRSDSFRPDNDVIVSLISQGPHCVEVTGIFPSYESKHIIWFSLNIT